MIIPIKQGLRVTSDRYQWIVERNAGERWDQILFLHSLPNVAPMLVREKLCTPHQSEAVREVARQIAAHLRDVGAPLAEEVYRQRPPRRPNPTDTFLPIGTDGKWAIAWLPAGHKGNYQFMLYGEKDDQFGVWATLRRTLKECLLLRVRLGDDPSFWPVWSAELAEAAERGASGAPLERREAI